MKELIYMPTAHWNSLYRAAYERGVDRLRAVPGVCCAFHSVVDGLIRLTPEMIAPLLEENPSFKQAALAGCHFGAPLEIQTPEDFIQGLFCSLSRGAAMQRIIRSPQTQQWVWETFGPGEHRLGGTAGNMARSLAPLGIPVTVYANPLTAKLAELFGDFPNLAVIARQGGEFVKIPPKNAAQGSETFAIHWIFEYGSDFELDLDSVRVHPHRANRYIPSWNPINNQFHMSVDFAQGFLSLLDSYSHLLFSGFHIISERYPDGCTCVDVIKPIGDYLEVLRERSPKLKIHLELASIASPLVLCAMGRYIVPYMHSIGLNETELPQFLKSIDPQPGIELSEKSTPLEYCRAIASLLRTTPVERIHFHHLGYYLCLERKPWSSPEISRDALLFAAIMAAARAQHGLFSRLEDVEKGLSPDVDENGRRELAGLADRLNQPQLNETGIGTFEEWSLFMVPTRRVKNPLFTVGLGDTISSGAFLTA